MLDDDDDDDVSLSVFTSSTCPRAMPCHGGFAPNKVSSCFPSATLTEPQICYVLDGILFLYGIILTALYCRIKIINAKVATAENAKGKQPGDESIYTGLSPRAQDTYETIGMKK
uniref:Uncharacterized protein n=1 Tax=Gasterosteus aculeatus aculeatus TaxID=481459 RepID=A0AAQ4Q1S8_GASAC